MTEDEIRDSCAAVRAARDGNPHPVVAPRSPRPAPGRRSGSTASCRAGGESRERAPPSPGTRRPSPDRSAGWVTPASPRSPSTRPRTNPTSPGSCASSARRSGPCCDRGRACTDTEEHTDVERTPTDMSQAFPDRHRSMRRSRGLGHAPWVATGIVRCRFDRRRRERLGCVREELGRIVRHRLVRIDLPIRLRQWVNHAMSQPARRSVRRALRGRRGSDRHPAGA